MPAGGDQPGQRHRSEGARAEPERGDEGPHVDDRPDDQRLSCCGPGEQSAGPGDGKAECGEVPGEPGEGVGVGRRSREVVGGVVERVGRGPVATVVRR
jgi:hypothetical protein